MPTQTLEGINVVPVVKAGKMMNLDMPKTPAQRWREMSVDDKVFGVGQALRVIWELTKPVLLWTIFILAVGVWAVFQIVFKALLPK